MTDQCRSTQDHCMIAFNFIFLNISPPLFFPMIRDARQNGEVLYHMSDQDIQCSPDPLVFKNSFTDVKNSLEEKISE